MLEVAYWLVLIVSGSLSLQVIFLSLLETFVQLAVLLYIQTWNFWSSKPGTSRLANPELPVLPGSTFDLLEQVAILYSFLQQPKHLLLARLLYLLESVCCPSSLIEHIEE
jgi:hypothetical protein